MTTYAEALDKVGVSVPAHLIADAEIPVETAPQAQGDVGIFPAGDVLPAEFLSIVPFEPVPDEGVQVVFGEATGNSHWLNRGFESPGVSFARVDRGLTSVVVSVPEGQTAQITHTDEHGAFSLGAGVYALNGKRELADQIRRVTD